MADEAATGIQVPLEPQRRNFSGWIFLGVIFALLISMQAAQYFTRHPAEPLREVENRIHAAFSASGAFGEGASADTSLKRITDELETTRQKDIDAERIWVILTTETHGTVTPADLQRLRASNLKDGTWLSKIYEPQRLSPELARELTKQLQDDSRTSARLARIYAMEKAGLPSERQELRSRSMILVGLLLVLFCLAGLGLWIVFIGAKLSGAFPAAGHPAEPLTLYQTDAFALRAAQLMACFIIVPIMVSLFVPASMKMVAHFLAEIGILAAVFLLRRVPVNGEIISLGRIGFRSDHPARDVALGIAASAMNFPVILALGIAGRYVFRGLPEAEHPIQVELAGNLTPVTVLALLFAASIAAPLFEETLFRGLLLPACSRLMRSPVTGSIVTSILFATIHPTGIPAWPGLAAIGGMSCLLAYHTRSLVPSMVMHGVHNAITLGFAIAVGG